MNVLGIGTDIIECARIRQIIGRHDEYFLNRVYTANEIAYCQQHKAAAERFAGRFAAKEAVLKALGTGWRKGISWHDVEIRNETSGRPFVRLGGVAREHAERLRIGDVMISISHCRTHAIAYALALEAPASQQAPDRPASTAPDSPGDSSSEAPPNQSPEKPDASESA